MKIQNQASTSVNGDCTIADSQMYRWSPPLAFQLADNIVSVEVRGYNSATTGGDRLTRSAAGAVLGFLVAGPIGTIVGAGAGASGTKLPTARSYEITLTITSPPNFFFANVTQGELNELQRIFSAEPGVETERTRRLQRDSFSERREQLREHFVTPRKKVKSTKAAKQADLERKLAKLDFMHKEGLLDDAQLKERRALVIKQSK